MPTVQQQRDKLVSLLKELFQLDQPDLDFGFYRIMHAKAKQVTAFLENDLLKIVEQTFGQAGGEKLAALQQAYEDAIAQAKSFGAPDPEQTEPVKKAKAALEGAKDTTRAEGEVYDHLYRFFERYYEGGDFMSRRYLSRETSSKAAPYAVPYDGSDVYLHWANKDQYYIKTAEYFTNFTFDLSKAAEVEVHKGTLFPNAQPASLRVHFRIAAATEGEHGSVKASESNKRYFRLNTDDRIAFGNGELVCYFLYQPDTEKTGQEGAWQAKRNEQAVAGILNALAEHADPAAKHYLAALKTPAPTDKQKDRPVLARFVTQYAARNTTDYFIHRDLGGFLKRELDFYLKNEVLRLDDIESADAPKAEAYLDQLRCLRAIAGKIIAFLAQLEEFQKSLWLKRKFVTEARWCVTVETILGVKDDKVRSSLLAEIASNDSQRAMWVDFFSIDSFKGDLSAPGYSVPLVPEFLRAHPTLVIDTSLYKSSFSEQLVQTLDTVHFADSGLLICGENSHALRRSLASCRHTVKCMYIDPPYNTENDEFLYRDSYKRSSWLAMMSERLRIARELLADDGVIFISIDDKEVERLKELCIDVFGREQFLNMFSVKTSDPSGHKTVNPSPYSCIEYVLMIAKDRSRFSYEQYYVPSEYDPNYRFYITDVKAPPEKWQIVALPDVVAKSLGFAGVAEAKASLSPEGFEAAVARFALEHAKQVFQSTAISKDAGKDIIAAKFASQQKPDVVLTVPRNGRETIYLKGGRQIYFYANKVRATPEHPEPSPAKPLTNLWADIPWNGIANEGGVTLKNGKKPEKLLFRMYSLMRLKPGDLVMDFFLGSGTSSAVAAKMGLRWVGVEMSPEVAAIAMRRMIGVGYGDETGVTPLAKHHPRVWRVIGLESYEDCLNNLELKDDDERKKQLEQNPGLRADYMLHYMLDVETRGSASLLNIEQFKDPTAYKLKVKKPGSDEYDWKNVDLLETFNYLLGLRVEHIAAPQTFAAEFEREVDPDLPKGQLGRLKIKGKLKQAAEDAGGKWWFRKVEGWVPKNPATPNDGQREKVLIVWRKLTGDIEQDNLVLDEWFRKYQINPRESYDYDTIYVNGSNNLPNLKLEKETWRVRLIEEDFHRLMWDTDEA